MQSSIHAFTFEFSFKQCKIMGIKFPCKYFLELKTIDQPGILAKSSRNIQPVNNIVQFDEIISFDLTVHQSILHGKQFVFQNLSQQTRITESLEKSYDHNQSDKNYMQIIIMLNLVSLRSPDQPKLVGRYTLDLQKLIKREKSGNNFNEETVKLDYCSVNAYLTFIPKLVNSQSQQNIRTNHQEFINKTDKFNESELKSLNTPKIFSNQESGNTAKVSLKDKELPKHYKGIQENIGNFKQFSSPQSNSKYSQVSKPELSPNSQYSAILQSTQKQEREIWNSQKQLLQKQIGREKKEKLELEGKVELLEKQLYEQELKVIHTETQINKVKDQYQLDLSKWQREKRILELSIEELSQSLKGAQQEIKRLNDIEEQERNYVKMKISNRQQQIRAEMALHIENQVQYQTASLKQQIVERQQENRRITNELQVKDSTINKLKGQIIQMKQQLPIGQQRQHKNEEVEGLLEKIAQAKTYSTGLQQQILKLYYQKAQIQSSNEHSPSIDKLQQQINQLHQKIRQNQSSHKQQLERLHVQISEYTVTVVKLEQQIKEKSDQIIEITNKLIKENEGEDEGRGYLGCNPEQISPNIRINEVMSENSSSCQLPISPEVRVIEVLSENSQYPESHIIPQVRVIEVMSENSSSHELSNLPQVRVIEVMSQNSQCYESPLIPQVRVLQVASQNSESQELPKLPEVRVFEVMSQNSSSHDIHSSLPQVRIHQVSSQNSCQQILQNPTEVRVIDIVSENKQANMQQTTPNDERQIREHYEDRIKKLIKQIENMHQSYNEKAQVQDQKIGTIRQLYEDKLKVQSQQLQKLRQQSEATVNQLTTQLNQANQKLKRTQQKIDPQGQSESCQERMMMQLNEKQSKIQELESIVETYQGCGDNNTQAPIPTYAKRSSFPYNIDHRQVISEQEAKIKQLQVELLLKQNNKYEPDQSKIQELNAQIEQLEQQLFGYQSDDNERAIKIKQLEQQIYDLKADRQLAYQQVKLVSLKASSLQGNKNDDNVIEQLHKQIANLQQVNQAIISEKEQIDQNRQVINKELNDLQQQMTVNVKELQANLQNLKLQNDFLKEMTETKNQENYELCEIRDQLNNQIQDLEIKICETEDLLHHHKPSNYPYPQQQINNNQYLQEQLAKVKAMHANSQEQITNLHQQLTQMEIQRQKMRLEFEQKQFENINNELDLQIKLHDQEDTIRRSGSMMNKNSSKYGQPSKEPEIVDAVKELKDLLKDQNHRQEIQLNDQFVQKMHELLSSKSIAAEYDSRVKQIIKMLISRILRQQQELLQDQQVKSLESLKALMIEKSRMVSLELTKSKTEIMKMKVIQSDRLKILSLFKTIDVAIKGLIATAEGLGNQSTHVFDNGQLI